MLVALILANERPLRLVLSEIDKNRKTVIRTKSPSVARTEPDQIGVDLLRIGSVLTQAGLIPLKSIESWVAVSARTPDISIHSCLSLLPSPTKQVQFISMGINPVFAHSSANVLYNEVNRIFSASDFGRTGPYEEPEESRKSAALRTRSDFERTRPTTKGSSKGINRWPMFYIGIEMDTSSRARSEEAETLESNRSLQRILDVLGAMVHQFLEQHCFRPRTRNRPGPSLDGRREQISSADGDVPKSIAASGQPPILQKFTSSMGEDLDSRIKLPSFQKRPLSFATPNFGNWSRIKSGSGSVLDETCSGLKRRAERTEGISLPHRLSQEGSLRRQICNKGKADNEESVEGINRRNTESDLQDRIISWINPLTKSAVLINSRTGQCLPPRALSSTVMNTSLCCARPRSTGSLGDRRHLDVIKRPQSAPSGKSSLWLEDVMGQWDNPAFPLLEKPILSIHSDVNDEGRPAQKLGVRIVTDLSSVSTCGNTSVTKSSGKLWKRGLAEADVIAQVDRKFILVRMSAAPVDGGSSNPGSLLVLVDQHAADERCRIEELLDGMFTSQTTVSGSAEVINIKTLGLSSPIRFEIPANETRLFKAYAEFFASWGCHYEVSDIPEKGHAVVSVNALPILIAERCRAEPKLVMDLLRSEIWKREENNRGFPVRSAFATSKRRSGRIDESSALGDLPSWVGQLTDCPEGIVDLLNSRACRSAVMFNDVLSIEECENLISRLSNCVFPFQCAHGRPSMIPILDLTSQTRDDLGYEQPQNDLGTEIGFVEAFRAWKDT
jgi:DNA mismatch repair protein MLH3